LKEREKALEKENKRLERKEQQKENMDVEGESVAD
jgi:hypothetical protein